MLDDTLDLSTSLDPGLDIHLLCSNSGQLKIMHLNTQSMVLAFNELLLTVNSYPLATIIELCFYPWLCYGIPEQGRYKGRWHWCYIKENISYKRRCDIENAHPELEHLW